MLDLLNSYDDFFASYLQPVLNRQFHASDLAANPLCMDSTSGLVTALLPILRDKLARLLPVADAQPPLLSHLMQELMSFDSTLRDEWGYDGGRGAEGWRGLAWEVLARDRRFDRWLQVEKDCVFSFPSNGSSRMLTTM